LVKLTIMDRASSPLDTTLSHYRSRFESKPVLRLIYEDFGRRIAGARIHGTTLEIGGGAGTLPENGSQVISSDIQFAPWLNLVADAQRLPLADRSLANIVMVDVLHHLEFPLYFLREAARVLRPGGQVIMIEPAITPGSTLFYRLLHQEPVDMSVDPLISGALNPDRDPYDSNQAIPTLIATRYHKQLAMLIPELSLTRIEWFSLFVYPLTGGFKPWSLVTCRTARLGLALERRMEGALGRLLGFRLFMVFERSATL
jgi:SAM-dependent methyltransferase